MQTQRTNANGRIPKAWDVLVKKPFRALESPGFVDVVEERLSVVGNSFAFAIHHDGRVVEFGAGRPFRGDVDFFWVAQHDCAVIL